MSSIEDDVGGANSETQSNELEISMVTEVVEEDVISESLGHNEARYDLVISAYHKIVGIDCGLVTLM